VRLKVICLRVAVPGIFSGNKFSSTPPRRLRGGGNSSLYLARHTL
jgi:hypothetical protein